MNPELETDIKEFGLFVEKAVRAVRVPMQRKKRMRDELINHMHEVFVEVKADSEISRTEAISRTIDRMGDLKELTNEFRSEETLYNRSYLLLEELRYDPAKSMKWFLVKHFLIGFGLGFFVAGLILLLVFLKPNPLGVVGSIYVGLLTSVVHVLFVVPFLLLLDPITRYVNNLRGKPSRLRVISYLFAASLVLPSIAIAINYQFTSPLKFEHIVLGLVMAPALPLILLLASKPAAEEIIYCEKWANLEID